MNSYGFSLDTVLPEEEGGQEERGEWEEINHERKVIRRIEKAQNDYEESKDDVIYRVTVYKQREVILPEQEGEGEKPGEWEIINEDREALRRIEKEHKDYEETQGDVTYRVIIDRQREVKLPEGTPGPWREVKNDRKPICQVEEEEEKNVFVRTYIK